MFQNLLTVVPKGVVGWHHLPLLGSGFILGTGWDTVLGLELDGRINSILWSNANFAQMKSETKYLFFVFLVTEIEFCNLAAICICNFCRFYNKTI